MAKIEQASTATDARVANALIESSIIVISLEQCASIGGEMSTIMTEAFPPQEKRATVTESAQCALAVACGGEIWWDV